MARLIVFWNLSYSQWEPTWLVLNDLLFQQIETCRGCELGCGWNEKALLLHLLSYLTGIALCQFLQPKP